ncbi:MAG: Zn-ribbon domain-containing OB-fold protein [Chloroflexota bacterium]|nr:MAG: Zn-ribbon domain-containing OB-fold protein [Chloroflexota bacterium]
MQAKTMVDVEPMVYKGRIRMPYNWTAGETASRFFSELRERAQIWGTKCPACGMVFVPPKKTCGRCLKPAMEWVQVAPTGTLVTYTVVHYKEPAIHPIEAPFAYGIVRLDGADTGLVHLLGEVGPSEFVSGMRVEAVFEEERQGSLLDIKYFRPLRME